MSGEGQEEQEDLGYIRLLRNPPVEKHHNLRKGGVHKVVKKDSRGWWIDGFEEYVLVLGGRHGEAEPCEPPP